MVPASGSGPPEVLLLAGQIASGKTALATALTEQTACGVIRVREALQEVLGGAEWDRQRLQREGAALDQRSGGRWLLEYLQDRVRAGGCWVVDAGRTRRQVEPILEALTGSRLVYLRAHESTRRRRYASAQSIDAVKRSVSFDEAMNHPTEQEAATLAAMAHLVVDADDLSPAELGTEVRNWIGW